MIQLYKKGNENFTVNGDHVLHPVSCTVDRRVNGAWELEIEYPIVFEDRNNIYEDITIDAVVKVPMPEGDKLYRIYDTVKSTDTTMLAYARPIFMDAAGDTFFMDKRVVNKTGQEALDYLTEGTIYSGRTDISKGGTAYYVRKNMLEVLAGDLDNSFLKIWGGEILYDDFTIIVNERIGGDYGAEIRYGKNLLEIEDDTSMEEVVTRIVPVSYNGYTLDGNAPWVDSPLINAYARIRTKEIKYEDVKMQEDATGEDEVGFPTLADLRAELRRRCEQEFTSGIDKPRINLKVNMVDLEKTVEYSDYKDLEKVSLGDTVRCIHYKLGIDTEARVIRQVWDCVREQNANLEIGDFKHDYFNYITSASSIINSVYDKKTGNIMAEKISGFLDGMLTQFRVQNTAAQRQEVRAILFEDLDPQSAMYGALCIGTQGFQIASERTEDGRDWKWQTAANAKGIVADMILAGIIADKSGNNFWNLDTGEFRLSSGTTVGDTTLGEIVEMAGAAANVFLSLDNDYQTISVDANGEYGEFPTGITTTATVMYGTTDITNECVYSITESAGIQGGWNNAAKTYTVTGLTADTGWVDIKATYLQNLSVTKRFTVSKLYAGKDGEPGQAGEAGRTYFLEASATVVKRSADNTMIPNAIEFKAYYRDGTSAARTAYSGRFIVEETIDGENWTSVYTSSANESTLTHYLYTILTDASGAALSTAAGDVIAFPRNVSAVRCRLYAAGGVTTLLDIQSVAVVVDVDNLSAMQVLDILSSGWQGIYSANGKYYLSFEAARGGVLALGGPNNGNGELHVYDAAGNEIGYWTREGLYAKEAKIDGEIVSGSGNIAGFNITESAMRYDGEYSAYFANVNYSGSSDIFLRLRNTTKPEDIILVKKDGKAAFGSNGTFTDHAFAIMGEGGAIINEIYSYNQLSIVSDERFKDNIQLNEDDAIETLLDIDTYDFDWIESGQHEQCAFVAQQLKTVNPDFVKEVGKDHVLMIQSSRLIPYLVKAVQQIIKRLDKIESPNLSKQDKRSKWKPSNLSKKEKKEILKGIKKNSKIHNKEDP